MEVAEGIEVYWPDYGVGVVRVADGTSLLIDWGPPIGLLDHKPGFARYLTPAPL